MKDNEAPRLVMAAIELRRVIRNALLFACTDTTLPGICAVRFEMRDKVLTVMATDRYMFSRETPSIYEDQADGVGGFSLSTLDAKMLAGNANLDSKFLPVTIIFPEYSDQKVSVLAGHAGEYKFDPVGSEFPTWRYIGRERRGFYRDEIAFNSTFLGRLAKVQTDDQRANKRGVPVEFTFQRSEDGKSAGSVHRVKIGATFEARIVEMRIKS